MCGQGEGGCDDASAAPFGDGRIHEIGLVRTGSLMKIAVLKERRRGERRVAASPETTEKLIALGARVTVESGAGEGASTADSEYEAAGATIARGAREAAKDADVVLKVQRPMRAEEGEDEVALLQKGQALVCHLNAATEPELVHALAERGVSAFALELMPRISRAQSMDILSSQANVAGYKAVLDALEHYGRVMPMMSTAAGRINPAHVFVMGVGVAGLQAIATAKRLGAVVHATDVRPDTKEQVESLGGKFVAVENEEFLQAQTEGGYAKEMSEGYKRQQAALIAETIPKMDIVITTALIPGRPAPVLLTGDQVRSMKPGSVVVDLAAEAGGNCPLTELGKVVEKHGVAIVGHGNWPSRVPGTTSRLFARNILNFLTPMIDKETGAFTVDTDDEIVAGTLVTRDGSVVHPTIRERVTQAPAKKASAAKTSKKSAAKKAARKAPAKKSAVQKPTEGAPSDSAPPDKSQGQGES